MAVTPDLSRLYYLLVKHGRRTIEQVPTEQRVATKVLLDADSSSMETN